MPKHTKKPSHGVAMKRKSKPAKSGSGKSFMPYEQGLQEHLLRVKSGKGQVFQLDTGNSFRAQEAITRSRKPSKQCAKKCAKKMAKRKCETEFDEAMDHNKPKPPKKRR